MRSSAAAYWPTKEDEPDSPMGPLVAVERVELLSW